MCPFILFIDIQIPDLNFDGAEFVDCDFKAMSFKNSILFDSTFRNSNLALVDFSSADLSSVTFDTCSLLGVNLTDAEVNHKTRFKNITSIANCRISKFTIERLDDSRGGLQISQLDEMEIVDDFAELKFEFTGFWRLIHSLAILFFIFPYAFFLFKCWSISEGGRLFVVPETWTNETTIFDKLLEYIWTGGELDGEFSYVFLITLFLILYNFIRACLMYKTLTLEQKQMTTRLPVKFSFEDSVIGKLKWKNLFSLMKFCVLFNIGFAFIHFLIFMNKPLLPIL